MKKKRSYLFIVTLILALTAAPSCMCARNVNMNKQENANATANTGEDLKALRNQIDSLDNELIDVLAKRMNVCMDVGIYKKEHGVSIVQSDRFKEILENRSKEAKEKGLDENFVKQIMILVHDESVRLQKAILEK